MPPFWSPGGATPPGFVLPAPVTPPELFLQAVPVTPPGPPPDAWPAPFTPPFPPPRTPLEAFGWRFGRLGGA